MWFLLNSVWFLFVFPDIQDYRQTVSSAFTYIYLHMTSLNEGLAMSSPAHTGIERHGKSGSSAVSHSCLIFSKKKTKVKSFSLIREDEAENLRSFHLWMFYKCFLFDNAGLHLCFPQAPQAAEEDHVLPGVC